MNSRKAVKALIVDNDKILIVKRSKKDLYKPGVWELPGGKIKQNESLEQGLIREVKEETGINIEVLKHLNNQVFMKNKETEIIMTTFLCKALTKDIILSDEHEEYEWSHIEKTKQKLTEFFHEEFDLYLKNKID